MKAPDFQASPLCPEKIPHRYSFCDFQGCEGESSYAVNNMPASVEMVYRWFSLFFCFCPNTQDLDLCSNLSNHHFRRKRHDFHKDTGQRQKRGFTRIFSMSPHWRQSVSLSDIRYRIHAWSFLWKTPPVIINMIIFLILLFLLIVFIMITTAGCVKNLAICKIFQLEYGKTVLHTA